jgi:hypothetical protein
MQLPSMYPGDNSFGYFDGCSVSHRSPDRSKPYYTDALKHTAFAAADPAPESRMHDDWSQTMLDRLAVQTTSLGKFPLLLFLASALDVAPTLPPATWEILTTKPIGDVATEQLQLAFAPVNQANRLLQCALNVKMALAARWRDLLAARAAVGEAQRSLAALPLAVQQSDDGRALCASIAEVLQGADDLAAQFDAESLAMVVVPIRAQAVPSLAEAKPLAMFVIALLGMCVSVPEIVLDERNGSIMEAYLALAKVAREWDQPQERRIAAWAAIEVCIRALSAVYLVPRSQRPLWLTYQCLLWQSAVMSAHLSYERG